MDIPKVNIPDLTPPSALIPDFLKKDNPELEMLYLALRRADQAVLDEFFAALTPHQSAMIHGRLLPMESLLLMMLLEDRKWLRRQVAELQAEIQQLTRKEHHHKGHDDH